MDRRLHLIIMLVIIVSLLVGCLMAEGGKSSSGKKRNRDKSKKQKGEKGGGGGGGQSKVDRAIRSVLKNMAKISKPLRIPPPPPPPPSSSSSPSSKDNNKKNNDKNKDNPPHSSQLPVAVSVDFGITAVSEVNADGGYVDLEGSLSTMWQDSRLQYDLSKVSQGISTLRVDPQTIWTPDLEVYNAVAPGMETLNSRPLAQVTQAGDVFFVTQVRIRTACDVIGQLSTSEVVNCTVKMGSWTYNGSELQLNMNIANIDRLHDFEETGPWTIVGAKAWIGSTKYACCPDTYPYIRFSYILRKRVLPSP